MITRTNLRSILPGKIARTVMLIAERDGVPSLTALKNFYSTNLYRQLEQEETKMWWCSPEQLARGSVR